MNFAEPEPLPSGTVLQYARPEKPILQEENLIKATFGDLLAFGELRDRDGVKVVRWKLGSDAREMAPADSSAQSLLSELQRCIGSAERVIKVLQAAIDEGYDPILLQPEVLKGITAQLLVRADQDLGHGLSMDKRQAELIRDVLAKTVMTLQWALRKPRIVQEAGQAKLIGWGYCPPRGYRGDNPIIHLRLSYQVEGRGASARIAFNWNDEPIHAEGFTLHEKLKGDTEFKITAEASAGVGSICIPFRSKTHEGRYFIRTKGGEHASNTVEVHETRPEAPEEPVSAPPLLPPAPDVQPGVDTPPLPPLVPPMAAEMELAAPIVDLHRCTTKPQHLELEWHQPTGASAAAVRTEIETEGTLGEWTGVAMLDQASGTHIDEGSNVDSHRAYRVRHVSDLQVSPWTLASWRPARKHWLGGFFAALSSWLVWLVLLLLGVLLLWLLLGFLRRAFTSSTTSNFGGATAVESVSSSNGGPAGDAPTGSTGAIQGDAAPSRQPTGSSDVTRVLTAPNSNGGVEGISSGRSNNDSAGPHSPLNPSSPIDSERIGMVDGNSRVGRVIEDEAIPLQSGVGGDKPKPVTPETGSNGRGAGILEQANPSHPLPTVPSEEATPSTAGTSNALTPVYPSAPSGKDNQMPRPDVYPADQASSSQLPKNPNDKNAIKVPKLDSTMPEDAVLRLYEEYKHARGSKWKFVQDVGVSFFQMNGAPGTAVVGVSIWWEPSEHPAAQTKWDKNLDGETVKACGFSYSELGIRGNAATKTHPKARWINIAVSEAATVGVIHLADLGGPKDVFLERGDRFVEVRGAPTVWWVSYKNPETSRLLWKSVPRDGNKAHSLQWDEYLQGCDVTKVIVPEFQRIEAQMELSEPPSTQKQVLTGFYGLELLKKP